MHRFDLGRVIVSRHRTRIANACQLGVDRHALHCRRPRAVFSLPLSVLSGLHLKAAVSIAVGSECETDMVSPRFSLER
jgi:hypothetical protein